MTNDPTQCAKCGQRHARCSAHRRDGSPCGSPRVTGATVCRMHGGSAGQVKAAVERRKAEEIARQAVERFGLHADTNAHAQLARLINLSAGLVSFYEWQCQQLSTDALVWGDVEAREDFRGTAVVQKAEVNVWLRLFNDERRLLAQLCKTAIDAGLAEREVRLAERHGALIAEVLRRALSEAELTPQQQTRMLTVVPTLLREYAAEAESDTTVVSLPRGQG